MALVHNGNLTNDLPLREELDRSVPFRSNWDSELILHLLARSLGMKPISDTPSVYSDRSVQSDRDER